MLTQFYLRILIISFTFVGKSRLELMQELQTSV